MGHSNPAIIAKAVTPSDTTDLRDSFSEVSPRSLYIGGAGNLNVVMDQSDAADTAVLFSGVLAGTILPIRVKKVMSTSTTATNIVALG